LKIYLQENETMKTKLSNRTILITGGATGIGLALADQLSKTNRVIITGRRIAALEEAKRRNSSLTWYQSDVSNPNDIDSLFETLKRANIVIDVLINNAGVIELWDLRSAQFTSREVFEKINTNLTGAICMTKQFIRQASIKQINYIINITTEVAIMPIPILPLYSSSKAGFSVFTKCLRQQLAKSNFKVIEILPPAVDTAMPKKINNTSPDMLDARLFAEKVIGKIESGVLEYAPGKNAYMFSLLRRLSPSLGIKLIDTMSRKQLGV
jgi:uncharacterized oxidoreductase